VRLDWTLQKVLAWIAADDARCHDDRLIPVLDAVDRALGPAGSLVPSAVALVRSLASRIAADPTLGRRLLDEVVPDAAHDAVVPEPLLATV
jgi:hypothetical protein